MPARTVKTLPPCIARTLFPDGVNYAETESGQIYMLFMRGGFVGGCERKPELSWRKVPAGGPTSKFWVRRIRELHAEKSPRLWVLKGATPKDPCGWAIDNNNPQA